MSVGVLRGTAQSMEWVEQDEAKHHDITLVTQCSLSRLPELPPLTVHWQVSGQLLISITVYHRKGMYFAVCSEGKYFYDL